MNLTHYEIVNAAVGLTNPRTCYGDRKRSGWEWLIVITFENGFEALKRALKLTQKTGGILCQLTDHVKTFFLPIDQTQGVGYYHIRRHSHESKHCSGVRQSTIVSVYRAYLQLIDKGVRNTELTAEFLERTLLKVVSPKNQDEA